MICNTDALPVLLWLNILLSMTIGRLLNLKQNAEEARLQNIPADNDYSKKGTNWTWIHWISEEYNQKEEIKATQTGAKVLNNLMIPGTTSINQ